MELASEPGEKYEAEVKGEEEEGCNDEAESECVGAGVAFWSTVTELKLSCLEVCGAISGACDE